METVGVFLLFPVWWYSRGLIQTFQWVGRFLRAREEVLGIRMWFASMGKPMYGQHDWQSRVISFVFRVLILIVRILTFLAWIIFVIIAFLLYCVIPFIVVYGLLSNI
jgi:hypothetical protein